jgi:hypothetical protein
MFGRIASKQILFAFQRVNSIKQPHLHPRAQQMASTKQALVSAGSLQQLPKPIPHQTLLLFRRRVNNRFTKIQINLHRQDLLHPLLHALLNLQSLPNLIGLQTAEEISQLAH